MTLRRNAVANSLGQGWVTAMNLAFIPFYVRYLGLEAFGLVGIYALLQTWLALLDMGLTPALSREMARDAAGPQEASSLRDLLRSVEVAAVGVGAIVVMALWAASGWIASEWLRADTLSVATVARAFSLMAMVAGLRFFENVYRSSLVGLQRQVALNVVSSVMATLRGAGTVVVLVWVDPSIQAFFVWHGIVSAASVVALAVLVYRSLPRTPGPARFSASALRSVRSFAGGTVLITALGFVLSQSDKLVLSKLVTLESFGLYSIAYSAASAVRLLAQPIDQAVYPRLTQLFHQDEHTSLASLYHKATQFNVVLVGSVGVFLVLFGESVLGLWIQNADLARATHRVFWILVIGMVLNAVMNGPYYLQLAAGWTALLVKVNVAMVLLFVPTIWVLTYYYGAVGAAAAWLLLNLVYVIAVARLMHKRLLPGELREWYVSDLLAPLTAASAAGLALKLSLPHSADSLATIAGLILALALIMTFASVAARCVRTELRINLRLILGRSW